MISFLPIDSDRSAEPTSPRPTRESIRAALAELDPSFHPESPGYPAALVLIAGREVGHNIDRIARLTGVAREEVARMARRLFDNEVWVAGNTVSRWCHNPADLASFRNDVGVAEGRLCRKVDELGRVEWAPAGHWRKDFTYVVPRNEDQPRVVVYHPHVPIPEPEPLYYPDAEEDPDLCEELVQAPEQRAVPVTDDPGPRSAQWLGNAPGTTVDHGEPWNSGPNLTFGESCSNTVWLGGEVAGVGTAGD